MSVYKRENSEFYSYDFRIDGKRYSGFTGAADVDEARRFEQMMKNDAMGISGFCRAILKRAKARLPDGRRSDRGYVYMMRSGYFIKIGISVFPAERLKQISTAHPDGCELLFCFPGDQKLERELHAEFAACHYKKEWFFLCGKLKQFVTEFEEMQAAQQKVSHDLPRENVQTA